jgi:hypothetical protein
MTGDRQANAAVQAEQRKQTKIAVGAMLVPLFFVVGFALCIIGTYHKPHPNDIRVAVVGPPAQTAPLRAGMAKAGGSAFSIREVPTVAAATHAVRQRELDAAFVPSTSKERPATVVVASAGGRIVATAAETFVRGVTTKEGQQLVKREVRPLADGDEIGLGIFMFIVVATIAGYIAPTVLETLTPGLVPSRRYPILGVTALLVATLAYLIGGLGFGTYEGSFGTILAFIGVGALYAFVIGLGTRFFQVLLGPAAIFVSLAIFVFLNIPSLGATYTTGVLSPFWQFLHHFWIGASAVDAERGLLYFDGLDVGTAVLKMLAWVGVLTALLLLPAARRLERRREHAVPVLAAGMPSSA